MAIDAGTALFLQEQLAAIGPISVRRMFGGGGVYADGIMFGLLIGDALYFKAGKDNQSRFKDEGMAPFSYVGRGRVVALSYWRVPERLLDDPDELCVWARRALADARNAKASGRRKADSGKQKPRHFPTR